MFVSRKKFFHKKERVEVTPLLTRVFKETLLWLIGITLAIGFAYLISVNVFLKTRMAGESMKPTIEDGKVLIINKLAYRFLEPKRFDVVVYKQSNKEHSYYEVKRVVGLPKENIVIKDGAIYVNNEKLDEVVNVIPSLNGGLAEEMITLGENEFFVLGDNREDSEDSRFASVGNILKNEIVGEAILIEKPFSFVSSLNKIEKE